MSLAVATYNVLADAYVHPRRYRGVSAEVLDKANRRSALLRRIAGLNADLLCLQEVEREVFEFLRGELSGQGYRGLWFQKDQGRPDGCATLWRESCLRAEADHCVFFQDGPAGGVPSGHLALVGVFLHDGRRLAVINTHLKWDDPKKVAEQRWCCRQAREILASLGGFLPAPAGWILCGDLNVSPEDEVLLLLKQGGFRDAFEDHVGVRTCWANGRATKIDHILHTAGLRARPQAPPSLDGVTALPSPTEPSDHVPLEARLAWVD